MMQDKRLSRPVRSGSIRLQTARDNLRAACNFLQRSLEFRRLIARRTTRALEARSKLNDLPAGLMAFSARVFDDGTQDFAIAFRRDRQAMLEIPRRKAPLI